MTHEIREIMNEEKEKNLLRTKRPFPNVLVLFHVLLYIHPVLPLGLVLNHQTKENLLWVKRAIII